jgi:mycothione reductase
MGKKVVIARNNDGDAIEVKADEILVATGRASWNRETQVEKTGVEVDEHGWVKVNELLQTTKKGIWACGDTIGKYMFKHVANYESEVIFYNAFGGRKVRVDYHAVPHAIFTEPQVAHVGMKEEEARKKYDILIGDYKYQDTAMGEAMRVKDYFVKVIVDRDTYRILGATIVGPEASVLIQEIINLMYTKEQA